MYFANQNNPCAGLPVHKSSDERVSVTNSGHWPVFYARPWFSKWWRRYKWYLVMFVLIALYTMQMRHSPAPMQVHGLYRQPNDPHMTIFMLTSEATFHDRGRAVMDTWGKRAEERGIPVYFASSVYFYRLNYYDWIMKVDDDTYVNIDQLLSGFKEENPNELRLLGHMDSGPVTRIHSCFGGSGYILSRRLLRMVGPFLAQCRLSVNMGAEDVLLADCIGRNKPPWFDGCLPFRNDVKDMVEDLTGMPVDGQTSVNELMPPIGEPAAIRVPICSIA
ncbi:hypothetical protein K493DRAFT_364340 [Basidiobolus meristosporus CBS 931.73]|uniref:N-acetylgalactosaminide beta-1,3-galactosyltransferase n=1 Tax=Basidiobolus meristosporus CBS 931.73 TaxID=1314790 RepID=A0A1Y1WE18_9FUNG|nr:hypothetical protein K493DRAFT_364340 [Basidiobolus meristosporus CBS 931.73]|eukprot:ORX71702.1 hypothetical protein K493DRAFT_364340 [Basidiobolus meristosporus CBS 931.73]